MKILVTGAKGFVGKNLCATLYNIKDGKDRTRPDLKIEEVFEYDIDTDPELLDKQQKIIRLKPLTHTSDFCRGIQMAFDKVSYLVKRLTCVQMFNKWFPVNLFEVQRAVLDFCDG